MEKWTEGHLDKKLKTHVIQNWCVWVLYKRFSVWEDSNANVSFAIRQNIQDYLYRDAHISSFGQMFCDFLYFLS